MRYIALFGIKKRIIHFEKWQGQNDTIFQDKFGILPTDVISENFCSSLQRIAEDGFNGYTKPKSAMAW